MKEGKKGEENGNVHSTIIVSPNSRIVILIEECAGSRMYKTVYIFDSVLYQGMILVKFECFLNELTKALTYCCSLSLVNF